MSLHRTELGESGPRVVFCHGLFGQGKNWTSVAKALAPDHTSLLVDLPNHGRSAWTDSSVQMWVSAMSRSYKLAWSDEASAFALDGETLDAMMQRLTRQFLAS